MSVFVDIRQRGEPSQPDIGLESIVRLQSLDECKRFSGNTRKVLRETFIGTWGESTSFGESASEGELTPFLPISGEDCPIRIELDQIERQVIECRPDLIYDFASKDGDVGAGLPKLYCAFLVRLRNDGTRLISGICEDGALDSADLFRSPDEFYFSGLDSREHSRDNNTLLDVKG
jgi:hypothetical protein